jgi:RsiW-degrading membrane proteinase PrsW (M82 family)
MKRKGFILASLIALGGGFLAAPMVPFAYFLIGMNVVFWIFGEAVEEMLKATGLLWIVYNRPKWVNRVILGLWYGILAGLAFATVENLIYGHIYLADLAMEDPLRYSEVMRWRWGVCSALHAGCSGLLGSFIGKSSAVKESERSELIIKGWALAFAIHLTYNLLVTFRIF